MLIYKRLASRTFELKNQLTKQNTDDAVEQYKTDRDPTTSVPVQALHGSFAADDARVKFCTKLAGKTGLPFDKGYKDVQAIAQPDGIATDYL